MTGKKKRKEKEKFEDWIWIPIVCLNGGKSGYEPRNKLGLKNFIEKCIIFEFQVSGVAIQYHYKVGVFGFKQQKFNCSLFKRTDVQTQGVSRTAPLAADSF